MPFIHPTLAEHDEVLAEAMSKDRAREQRLRRAARRQGLQLSKSRTRDPRALDYGVYYIVDPNLNARLGEPCRSLDEVEAAFAFIQRHIWPSR